MGGIGSGAARSGFCDEVGATSKTYLDDECPLGVVKKGAGEV